MQDDKSACKKFRRKTFIISSTCFFFILSFSILCSFPEARCCWVQQKNYQHKATRSGAKKTTPKPALSTAENDRYKRIEIIIIILKKKFLVGNFFTYTNRRLAASGFAWLGGVLPLRGLLRPVYPRAVGGTGGIKLPRIFEKCL